MRRGIAGENPLLQSRAGALQRAAAGRAAPPLAPAARPIGHAQVGHVQVGHGQVGYLPVGAAQNSRLPDARANIGRLFADLRTAMRLTPEAAAHHVQTDPAIFVALETGRFDALPPWPETARIVLAYTAMAGIDGRPVLAAIAACLQADLAAASTQPVPKTGYPGFPGERLRLAGTALAHGAKRLPAGAIKQVRERPERAFYAVSLPLGVLLLVLNSGSLQSAMHHVPRPLARMASDVRQYFQEQFAPVHDGLRWIEVDNPRRRRGDKLPRATRSD